MPPRIIPILDRLRQDIAAALTPETIEAGLPPGGPLLAEAHPRPRHHHLPLPAPGPPRQHRLHRTSSTSAAGPSPTAPTARPASDSRWPSITGSSRRSPPPSGPPPRATRVGSATASGSSTARASPCPTNPNCNATSASPAASARAAASRWPSGWRCSTSPPGCCSARRRTVADPRDVADRRRSRGSWSPATSCWETADSARMLTWRYCRPRPPRGVPRPSEADRRLHPGPASGRRRGSKDVPGLPRSRWVLAQGDADQVVDLVQAEMQAVVDDRRRSTRRCPESSRCASCGTGSRRPGYRVREITLVTTLLDAAAYPASALAELYFRRWQIEINFRHIKITHENGCTSVQDGGGGAEGAGDVRLAYNLVRSAMVESAGCRGWLRSGSSLVDTVRWLIGVGGGGRSRCWWSTRRVAVGSSLGW